MVVKTQNVSVIVIPITKSSMFNLMQFYYPPSQCLTSGNSIIHIIWATTKNLIFYKVTPFWIVSNNSEVQPFIFFFSRHLSVISFRKFSSHFFGNSVLPLLCYSGGKKKEKKFPHAPGMNITLSNTLYLHILYWQL